MRTLLLYVSFVAATQPHIIFILSDDLGWADVGFRSNQQIKTPAIDWIAANGRVLGQYYVQSVCSPSRATFMTGRYPLHHTVTDWLKTGYANAVPLNETFIPQRLSAAGYKTRGIGKWHMGFTKWAHTPTFRGFDSWYGFYTGGEDYFAHTNGGWDGEPGKGHDYARKGYDFHRDDGPNCGAGCSHLEWEAQGSYSTTLFSDEAVRVISEHDLPAPLFMYLAYQAMHAPGEVPDSYRDAYNGSIADAKRRTFAGMLTCMDEGIGNVTAALRARDMLDDALVVFSSDNGGPTVGTPGGDFIGSYNYPLRGGKHTIWEGGTRVVAAMWAGARTGLIPPALQGSTTAQLMHGSDWFATLCELGGASYRDLPLDGVDQRGPLFNDSAAVRSSLLYGQHDDAPNRWAPYDDALRDADGWKLIQGWGGKNDDWPEPANVSIDGAPAPCTASWCFDESSWPSVRVVGPPSPPPPPPEQTVMLFNVLTDPTEHDEVSALHPDIVARLSAQLDALHLTSVNVTGGGDRYNPDPACTFKPADLPDDPHVGVVWLPWC